MNIPRIFDTDAMVQWFVEHPPEPPSAEDIEEAAGVLGRNKG